MSTLPPADRSPESQAPEPVSPALPETALEQLLNLKHEVEQNYRTIARLQGLLYTLGTGLILAAIIAISVAGFFAYLLLDRERLARQEAEKVAAADAELLGRLVEMEGKLRLQEQQLQQFGNLFPKELTNLTDTVRTNEQQLQLVRDRLQKLEVKEQPPNKPN